MRFQRAASFGLRFRHRGYSFRYPRYQHPDRQALAGSNQYGCLCAPVDRRRRAHAGRNRQSSTSLSRLFSASAARFSAPVSHFSDNLGQVIRHGELFTVNKYRRNTHHVTFGDFVLEGAAIPICVCLIRGFSTAIGFSACTTSGRLWRK